MSANTKPVTDASFDADVLKAAQPVLVDFWAEWCGPCKQIGPVLDEIAGEMKDKLSIVKMNVDENPMTPSKYGIRGIPSLLLFKNGQLAAQKVGSMPKPALQAWLKEQV